MPIKLGDGRKGLKLSLDDQRELRWFFREASGDLGLHGVNLEPQIGRAGDPQLGAYERLARAVPNVERWRTIKGLLLSIALEHRQVLALAFGPPSFWAPYSEFGELAPIVELTPTALRRGASLAQRRHLKTIERRPPAREDAKVEAIRVDGADVRRAVERTLLPGSRDRVAIQAIRSEATALLNEAGKAFVQAQRKELRAWAGNE